MLFWLHVSVCLSEETRLFLQTLLIVSMQVYHLTHPDDDRISSACSGIAGDRGCNMIIMIPITILT